MGIPHFIILAFSLTQLTSAFAAEAVVAKEGAEAGFLAVGKPSSLKIHGKTPDLTGKVAGTKTGVQGLFEVELRNLETGIKLRDKHLTEKYLEVEKHPKAVLKIRKIGGLKEGSTVTAGTLPIEGDLTVRGVTRSVQGTIELQAPAGGDVLFQAAFDIQIADYQISTPSFAGITVTDKVTVEARGKMRFAGGTPVL
jgi:polyisoprenoid-binding protein YceI